MSNCNSLSCGRHGTWASCSTGGCTHHNHHACNHCSCVASDVTPACNPWAPWGNWAGECGCGRCSHQNCNTYGCSASDTAWGCNQCDACWNNTGNSGYLIPRYRSIGRTFQRRITQTLCVDDIPPHAETPLTLTCVTVSGQATWEQISECRQQLLRVTVPVAVQIRDCSGRFRTGHSTVTMTIPLCDRCPAQDFWRGQLYVAPCIRLAAPVTENEDGCFDATLETQAEVYLVDLQATNC